MQHTAKNKGGALFYPSVKNNAHTPISITGNDEFMTQANAEGWPGDGSEEKPFVIDGLTITALEYKTLIDIQNTTVHFQTSNCLLTDGSYGIYLYNVINGYLINNTIINSSENGIHLLYSDYNDLVNNKIINAKNCGFYLQNSNFNHLTGNEASNNWGGVYLVDSAKNKLMKNIIMKNSNGIRISESHENMIIENEINNTNIHGISVIWSENCTFLYNIVANNEATGIFLFESDNNNFSLNTVENNSDLGFNLLYFHVNIFFGNTISHQFNYGIQLFLSMNNKISWNNFINNTFNSSSSQALDDGIANLFSYNYWSDWTSPDENNDSIVDIPYTITRTAHNLDLYPLVAPYSPNPPLNGSNLRIEPIIIFLGILTVFGLIIIYHRTKKARFG